MLAINAQQARLLRLAVLSLGSAAILGFLFLLSNSVTGPVARPASPWSEVPPPSGAAGWGAWKPSVPTIGSGGSSAPIGKGGGALSGSALFEGNIPGPGVAYDEANGRFRYGADLPWLPSGGRLRRRILAGSAFGAHEDVYISLVHSLKAFTDSIRIYTPGFRWGFADVVHSLGIHDGAYHEPVLLANDLARKDLFKGEDAGKKADMVILGTCEFDMERFSAELWKQYEDRPADDKFIVVCVVHNAFATKWLVEFAQNWVRAGALRLMPISAHVKRAFIYALDTYADTPPLHKIGFDSVPIHVHIPLLPLSLGPRAESKGMLTNAVIQGNFDPNRRDYAGVFGDLLAELERDPKPWGYRRVGTGPEFHPNPTAEITPFVLHLAGNGQMEVPKALANVVRVHTGLAYDDFFKTMHSMDVALLAFTPASSEETKGGYYEVQASSSVAMAMMCEVPLLATNHMHKVYTYTRDERVSITRPAFFREIEAVKLLRAGAWIDPSSPRLTDEDDGDEADGGRPPSLEDEDRSSSELGVNVVPPGVAESAQRMLDGGWRRSDEGWRQWRAVIDGENREVARRVLMGM